MPRKLIFVTGNSNKLSEVQDYLGSTVELESQSLDITEIQGTIEEITRDKCLRAAEILKGPVLVEDTSLCFNALNGFPGPYVKWFMRGIGHEGLNNLLAAYEDKSAEAVCTFGYCEGQGHEVIFFQGRTQGKIVPARGLSRFGWDPIFEYEGKTFAEMETSEKNKISHRGKALQKLSQWMAENL